MLVSKLYCNTGFPGERLCELAGSQVGDAYPMPPRP